MDDAVAMRFRQPGADLAGNYEGFRFGQSSLAQPLRERLALEKLHRDEVELAAINCCRVDFENLTDVRMADLPGVPHFRRKLLAETGFGAFDGHAPVELLVHGFIDCAHAALAHLARNAKAAVEQFTWLKNMLVCRRRKQRLQQEAVHTLFPLDIFPDFLE